MVAITQSLKIVFQSLEDSKGQATFSPQMQFIC